MKLHAFDALIGGHRLRGFTRDRHGANLRRTIQIVDNGLSIKAGDWKYYGQVTINKNQAEIARKILRSIKSDGYAVTTLPSRPAKFYVFDLQMDSADLRIYSCDRELVEFRKRRRQMELGAKGKEFLGEEEVFVGEVEIDSRETATRMGIDDYELLLEQGFCVAQLRAASFKDKLERGALRAVRAKAIEYGVNVLSLQIDSIKFSDSASSTIDANREEGSIGTEPETTRSPDDPMQSNTRLKIINKNSVREKLRLAFVDLHAHTNAQTRGYALEKFLNDLFTLEGLQPRRSFKLMGEQIDGSFTWRHRLYLLEAKWTKQPAAGAEFGAFAFKIDGKTADTRGLFISINGYSVDAVSALQRKGNLRFVCIDGAHLMRAVEPSGYLPSVLEQVWRHADETGEVYLTASKLKL